MERKEIKANYTKILGWHWLAKEVADYCNTSTQMIMDSPALEVAGWVYVIKGKVEYNNL